MISIKKPGVVTFTSNDLKASDITISDKTTGNAIVFTSNVIDAPLSVSVATANTGQTEIDNNTFKGTASFTYYGTGVISESNNVNASYQNTYEADAFFTHNGAGNLYIARNRPVRFHGNLTIDAPNPIFTQQVFFGGSAPAILERVGGSPIDLGSFTIEKTDGATLTLGNPVNIRAGSTATFTSGYILASAANPLHFVHNANNVTGAGDGSHVVGPVHKTGNVAFTFPIGSGEKLFSARISAPSNTADRFSAEFLAVNPGDDGYDTDEKDGTLTKVFDEGYWDIQPVAPTTGNVFITLGYNVPSGYITDQSKLLL